MKCAKSVIALLFLTFLAGCAAMQGSSSIQVTSYYDPSAKFANLQTYDWLPNIQEYFGDSRVNKSILDPRVQDAVNTVLTSKGFTLTSGKSPDFLVRYHAMVGDWKESGNTPQYVWDEGTLVLDILNPKTQAQIWRGIASARLSEKDPPEKIREKINNAVKEMLAKFPPQ